MPARHNAVMRVIAVSLTLALALGCERQVPPPIPRVDANYADAAGLDAFVRRDSGPRIPSVDGAIEEAEWERAVTVRAEVPTDRPGSTLSRLSALLLGDRLYVAVAGTLAEGDSVVVYVDRDHGGPDGVADAGALADTDGALDAAITQPSLDASGVAVDLAWGTTLMPHEAVGLDDAAGWRDVAGDPSAYGWIAAEDGPTVCSASACETSIDLAALGVVAPRRIALFARIARADGGLTNQTLPEDDADRPERVRALLTIEEPAPVPDAGTPDAGVDAGGGGIVIDGVLTEPEWAAASVFTSGVVATGSFAGNALRTLRTLRDATRLYVAIEATLTAGNAIVMYVDQDFGGEGGLVSPTPLEDLAGMLDRALSKELFTGAELRVDFAWGTVAMNRVATATDDLMGWRDVGTDPSSFRAIDGLLAPSACSAGVCETAIDLATLEVPAGAPVALFVRLVAATSLGVSNQTLPMDDASAPETVSVVAVLPAP